jgi:hypothetical protein
VREISGENRNSVRVIQDRRSRSESKSQTGNYKRRMPAARYAQRILAHSQHDMQTESDFLRSLATDGMISESRGYACQESGGIAIG